MTGYVKRVTRKWRLLAREAGPVFLLFLANLGVCAVLFSWLEDGVSLGIGAYWAVISGTTVGFGDVLPHRTLTYVLTVYTVLSSLLLNDIRAARVVKVMIDDPDLYSDLEQERDEAADALQLSWMHELMKSQGLDPTSVPEWDTYLKAVEAEKKDKEKDA